jgi:hypothetical protein
MNVSHPGEPVAKSSSLHRSFYTSPPDDSCCVSASEANQHTPVTIGHHLFFSRSRSLPPATNASLAARLGKVISIICSIHVSLLLLACLLLSALAYTASPVYAWPSILYVRESFYYDANGHRVGWEYTDECAEEYYVWGKTIADTSAYTEKQCSW